MRACVRASLTGEGRELLPPPGNNSQGSAEARVTDLHTLPLCFKTQRTTILESLLSQSQHHLHPQCPEKRPILCLEKPSSEVASMATEVEWGGLGWVCQKWRNPSPSRSHRASRDLEGGISGNQGSHLLVVVFGFSGRKSLTQPSGFFSRCLLPHHCVW